MLLVARLAVVGTLALVSALAIAPAALADPTPSVTAVDVVPSVATFYPHADGYLDTVSIDVTPTSTDGAAAASTGLVTITHGSKVEKSWKLTGGAAASLVWNGHAGSKIVAGSYAITATYTNPDASTAVGKSSVIVSTKKLVAHHWSKVAEAGKITDCYGGGPCSSVILTAKAPPGHIGKAYLGAEYTGLLSADVEDSSTSHVTLPSSVANAIKAKMSVSASVSIAGKKGHRFYLAACAGGSGSNCDDWSKFASRPTSGAISSPTVTLIQGAPDAAWLACEKVVGSKATVGHYTAHVTYYTLG